jgi:hypothetical protein
MKTAFAMVIGLGEAGIRIETLKAISNRYLDSSVWVRNGATFDETWEARAWMGRSPDKWFSAGTLPCSAICSFLAR